MSRPDTEPRWFTRLQAMSERDPRRAVIVARRVLDRCRNQGDHAQAWAVFALGAALLRWEQPNDAKAQLQDAIHRFTKLCLCGPVLRARHAWLAAELALGGSPELQKQLNDLAAYYEQSNDLSRVLSVRFDQISFLNVLGLPRESLQLIETIQPLIAQVGTKSDQARVWRLTAVALRLSGRLEQAHTTVNLAIQAYKAAGNHVDAAKSLFEHGVIHQRMERYGAATNDLEQANAIFRRFAMPLWQAYCQKDSGLIATRLGKYDQAIASTLEARSHLKAMHRNDYVAGCDLNLGNIAFYCGLHDLAMAAYQRAEQQFSTLQRMRMVLICRRNQALIYQTQGLREHALDVLEPLPALAEALGERVELAEAMLASGVTLCELGLFAEGRQRIEAAQHLFAELGDAPGAALCQLEQSVVALQQGEPLVAMALLEQIGDRLNDQPLRSGRVAHRFARCLEQLGRIDEAIAYYRRANQILAERRQRIANEHASSGMFQHAQSLLRDALGAIIRSGDALAALEIAENVYSVALTTRAGLAPFAIPEALQHELEQHRQHIQRLVNTPHNQRELDATIQSYTEVLLRARHTRPISTPSLPVDFDIGQLRARCNELYPAGWLVLEYIPYDERLLLVVAVDAQDTELHLLPLDEHVHNAIIRATAANWRPNTFLGLPQVGRESKPWATLTTLGEALIPPAIRQRLQPQHRLLIVPSGQLQHVAWAALRIDGAWLVERAVVQLVPSLQFWLQLTQRPTGGESALLLGVHSFHDRVPDLTNVGPSLDIVERVWPGPITRLEDEAVTRERLLALSSSGVLRDVGLLHIATHGKLAASRGLLAHLKLQTEDLFYDEIAQLQLSGATVVLAACDGALGEVLPGEEVLSLSRAFLIAGARDVFASQWPLYNNAMMQPLELLYQYLAAGEDAPTALAYAQRAMISMAGDSHQPLYAPLVWGGMVASGAGTSPSIQRVVPAPLQTST